MKKLLMLLLAFGLLFSLAACSSECEECEECEDCTIEAADVYGFLEDQYADQTITVYFVPSRPADEILTITAPLEQMLIDELARMGITIGGVEILVSASYEAAGEAMLAGTADVGFLPGGTYVMYADVAESPIDVILTATRGGLSKDSSEAIDWNDGEATVSSPTYQVGYYKGLIIAGTSAAARTLADKVNAGTALVWDDVKDLNWCVRSATSSSGYIYPAIWLDEMFGMTFDDVTGTVTSTGGYGDTLQSLASGTCDVGTIYADARRDYADDWTTTYGRSLSIWEETDVVGVTANIYNDTISVSSVNLDSFLINAIQLAFLHIADTPEGLDVMSVYSHEGYVIALDEDYDGARAAAAMLDE